MPRWSKNEHYAVMFAIKYISPLSLEESCRPAIRRVKARSARALGEYSLSEREAISAAIEYFADIFEMDENHISEAKELRAALDKTRESARLLRLREERKRKTI